MTLLISLAIIILILAIFSSLLIKESNHYKYERNKLLFSAAERSFLGSLDLAVADQYRILGKVRVADILSPAKGATRRNWRIAFNKIAAKHFDFVLCDKATLAVIAVIELDDKSHKQEKSITRDTFLNNACASAGLKIIRFEAKASYQPQAIRETINNFINPSSAQKSAA